MASMVNIHEAKTHLSRLLDRVAEGEEIVIARSGHPIARLVPLAASGERRSPGLLRGQIEVANDFDAPLADEVLRLFQLGSLEPSE
jgi:prevent-host-death family protein